LRQDPPNARFWVDWNGTYTKLTLRPGRHVQLHNWCRTDEGWASEDRLYSHTGTAVRLEIADCGADCDGRLDRFTSLVCGLDQLKARDGCEEWEETWGLLLPVWDRVSASQRDEQAEAAVAPPAQAGLLLGRGFRGGRGVGGADGDGGRKADDRGQGEDGG